MVGQGGAGGSRPATASYCSVHNYKIRTWVLELCYPKYTNTQVRAVRSMSTLIGRAGSMRPPSPHVKVPRQVFLFQNCFWMVAVEFNNKQTLLAEQVRLNVR